MQFCNLMWIVVWMLFHTFVGWQPYMLLATVVIIFGPEKNQSFRNNLGRPQPTRLVCHAVCTSPAGGGLDESRAARFLSAKPNESSSTSQRLIFTYLTHNTQHFPKGFSKSLRLKSFTPKNLKIEGYSTDMLQPREIMVTPRCSPRAAEFPTSVTFLHCRQFWSYGVSNFPNFRIMAYFPIQHS